MKRTLKKVFKKVVALSSAAAVMISCASSAFAISGIIPKSDEDLSSVLKFSSEGTDLSLFSTVSGELMNAENTADGAIQLGTQYKLSNGNYYAQSYTKGLNGGSEGKTVGLAFKVMAGSENTTDKCLSRSAAEAQHQHIRQRQRCSRLTARATSVFL